MDMLLSQLQSLVLKEPGKIHQPIHGIHPEFLQGHPLSQALAQEGPAFHAHGKSLIQKWQSLKCHRPSKQLPLPLASLPLPPPPLFLSPPPPPPPRPPPPPTAGPTAGPTAPTHDATQMLDPIVMFLLNAMARHKNPSDLMLSLPPLPPRIQLSLHASILDEWVAEQHMHILLWDTSEQEAYLLGRPSAQGTVDAIGWIEEALSTDIPVDPDFDLARWILQQYAACKKINVDDIPAMKVDTLKHWFKKAYLRPKQLKKADLQSMLQSYLVKN